MSLHRLSIPVDLPAGDYSLRVGLYDRVTLVPYVRLDGASNYEAGPIEIRDA